MVGRRPREYTRVSQIKLGVKIFQRLLALNPDMDPRLASKIATEAVRKHAVKHGKASEIYHEIAPAVVREFSLRSGDLGKVRALIQKVVAEVIRETNGGKEPLSVDTLNEMFNEWMAVGTRNLVLPEAVARYVIVETLRRLATYLSPDAYEALGALGAE